jgi:hypothetical protein
MKKCSDWINRIKKCSLFSLKLGSLLSFIKLDNLKKGYNQDIIHKIMIMITQTEKDTIKEYKRTKIRA